MRLYCQLNSSFPEASERVETNETSSWFMGLFADIEERAIGSSNLFGLLLEKTQEPPRLSLELGGIITSNFMPSRGSAIVIILRGMINLEKGRGLRMVRSCALERSSWISSGSGGGIHPHPWRYQGFCQDHLHPAEH